MGWRRSTQSSAQKLTLSLGLSVLVLMLNGSFAAVFVPSAFVVLKTSFTPETPLEVYVAPAAVSHIVVIEELAASTKRSSSLALKLAASALAAARVPKEVER